jgi:hypothetical protein
MVLEGCEQFIQFLQGGLVGGYEGFNKLDAGGEGTLELNRWKRQ